VKACSAELIVNKISTTKNRRIANQTIQMWLHRGYDLQHTRGARQGGGQSSPRREVVGTERKRPEPRRGGTAFSLLVLMLSADLFFESLSINFAYINTEILELEELQIPGWPRIWAES
jgi:hypothetical protein